MEDDLRSGCGSRSLPDFNLQVYKSLNREAMDRCSGCSAAGAGPKHQDLGVEILVGAGG
jgi:hypothetical protein